MKVEKTKRSYELNAIREKIIDAASTYQMNNRFKRYWSFQVLLQKSEQPITIKGTRRRIWKKSSQKVFSITAEWLYFFVSTRTHPVACTTAAVKSPQIFHSIDGKNTLTSPVYEKLLLNNIFVIKKLWNISLKRLFSDKCLKQYTVSP